MRTVHGAEIDTATKKDVKSVLLWLNFLCLVSLQYIFDTDLDLI
jgi:hypothetical protein